MANSGVRARCVLFGVCVTLFGCSNEDDSSPSAGVVDTATTAQPSTKQATSAVPAPEPRTVVETKPAPEAPAAIKPAPPPTTAQPANASSDAPQQHIVKGVVTQWSPMVLFVQPGDQIVFKQMAGHDSATIDGMIPEGGTTWQSKLGEEGFAVTIDTPGVYLYKCTPHVSLGMLGAIVVGDLPPVNLQQLKDHPQNKGMIGRAIRKLGQALDTKAGG